MRSRVTPERSREAWRRLVVSRLLLGLLTVVAAVVAPTTAAAAQTAEDPIRFGVSAAPLDGQARGEIALELAPGESATDYVSISNHSGRDLTFDVYPADAVITRDGDITVAARQDELRDVGSWIGFDVAQVEVPAGKRADVPFRVTVPTDVTPGDHVGAVLAALPRDVVAAEEPSVVVDIRTGARVHVYVPGEVESQLELARVDVAYIPHRAGLGLGALSVTYRIENTGNLRQSAVVALRPSALGGLWTGASSSSEVQEILPGQSLEVTETLTEVPPTAWLDVAVDLVPAAYDGYTAAPPVSEIIGTWAAPWVAAGALVLVVGLVTWRWVRRRQPIATGR